MIGERFKLVQHMLGDEVLSDFLAEDNIATDQYISVVTEDTKRHFHPETKIRVVTLAIVDVETVVPENPMTLEDVL